LTNEWQVFQSISRTFQPKAIAPTTTVHKIAGPAPSSAKQEAKVTPEDSGPFITGSAVTILIMESMHPSWKYIESYKYVVYSIQTIFTVHQM
jgi:hypothetical protein